MGVKIEKGDGEFIIPNKGYVDDEIKENTRLNGLLEVDPLNRRNPVRYKGESITKKDLRVRKELITSSEERELVKSKEVVDDSRNLATLGDLRKGGGGDYKIDDMTLFVRNGE